MIKTEIRKKTDASDLVRIAAGAALIAICSWISIPTAVPFTLQTFAVFLLLLLFGGERGTLSVAVYILIGLTGLPVFAGFAGGPAVLFGKTGGYILGFILTGLIYLLFTKLWGRKLMIEIPALILGLAVCYAAGTAWFTHIYSRDTGSAGILTVLGWCVFPFIVPDMVKLALAVAASKILKAYRIGLPDQK